MLLLVGLALLITEVFVPSGGMILIVAVVALIASVWCAWKAWWGDSPELWWSYVASVVVLIPAVVIGAFYTFPRTSFGRKILLEGPKLEDVTPFAAEEDHLMKLIGRRAMTLGLLSPGGLVTIDGERIHCETQGMMVESGQEVTVMAVKANRLIVRPVAPGDVETAVMEPEAQTGDDSPLDFDVPQS
jgi:membrane-bound ClpP family serine protease